MTNADVAAQYLAAFATGDPDSVAQWVTGDFVNEHTAALGGGCVGRDEYRRRLPGFLASFEGLVYDVEQIVAQDSAVTAAYTMRARWPASSTSSKRFGTLSMQSSTVTRAMGLVCSLLD